MALHIEVYQLTKCFLSSLINKKLKLFKLNKLFSFSDSIQKNWILVHIISFCMGTVNRINACVCVRFEHEKKVVRICIGVCNMYVIVFAPQTLENSIVER